MLQIDFSHWVVLYAAAGLAVVIAAGFAIFPQVFTAAKSIWTPWTRTKPPGIISHAQARGHGEWTPSPFKRPQVTPHGSKIADIVPSSYRPFRAGKQHVTMGLKALEWNNWIELDSSYEQYNRIRHRRMDARGAHLIKTLPAQERFMTSGLEAASELLQDLADYLAARYPSDFYVERQDADPASQIAKITVVPTKETFDLEDPSLDPLMVAALLIQDDIAILIEGPDGDYYLHAGAILVPGFWRLGENIGKNLDEIHLNGHVPHYASNLQPSLNKFFRKLKPETPVSRSNFFFQVINSEKTDEIDPLELAWCEGMGGPEDIPEGSRDKPSRRLPPVVTPGTIVYRTERQSLRRLPRTGAVVFTIRTYLVPLEELAKEDGVPERLASAIRGFSDDVNRYKNVALYGDILLSCLDEAAEEQIEAGSGKSEV